MENNPFFLPEKSAKTKSCAQNRFDDFVALMEKLTKKCGPAEINEPTLFAKAKSIDGKKN
ncbi:hypothetical protein COT07_04130 [Candidatus Woesearchaeota archaeon CG07_land_8_20_14_0_80_44_23]|nr:MAG: hypothetical protein COT07_04130 [Candidatus Woesearchaeota archaeon CG07_land_8_20_14_0_80_44_23]